jgi:hypothetical protein
MYFETYEAIMVILSKLEIHRNDIHVQKLCNNVNELLESCNESYLHKQQDNQAKI